jgi:hypothetical protein
MDSDELLRLAELCEKADGPDRELDAKIAPHLGWHQRVVTRLGLNGRTPGSWLWFEDGAPWGTPGRRNPPSFSGPRRRKATVAALRARAAQSGAST